MRFDNKQLSAVVFGISVLMISTMLSPAFAASSISYGPWTTKYANPSYNSGACTGASKACGYADNYGANRAISSANGFYDSSSATVGNNVDYNTATVGTTPSVTSSAGTIYFRAGVSYGGYLTIASGANAKYQPSLNMWGTSGQIGNCLGPLVNTAGLSSNTVQINCQTSNSGANTYYMAATHTLNANDGWQGGQTTADFWNSSYNARTNWLEICDYNC